MTAQQLAIDWPESGELRAWSCPGCGALVRRWVTERTRRARCAECGSWAPVPIALRLRLAGAPTLPGLECDDSGGDDVDDRNASGAAGAAV